MTRLTKKIIEQIADKLAEEQFPVKSFVNAQEGIREEVKKIAFKKAKEAALDSSESFYQVKDVEERFRPFLTSTGTIYLRRLPRSFPPEVRQHFGTVVTSEEERVLGRSSYAAMVSIEYPNECSLKLTEAIEKWAGYFTNKHSFRNRTLRELSQFTTVKKLTDAYPAFKRLFPDPKSKKKDAMLPMALLSSDILDAVKSGNETL